jgi:hypothetical protein
MTARTLAEVRTDIRTDINRSTSGLPDTRIDSAVKNVLLQFRAERLGFNIKRVGISMGDEYVQLPDDFIEIDAVKLDVSSYVKPMIEVGADWIHKEKRSPNFSSIPVYFAFDRNESTRYLRLYPPPDQTYSAEMTYLADLAESASFTDNLSLAWFDDAYLLVKYAAMAELELTYIGGESGQAKGSLYLQMASSAMDRIRKQQRVEQSSGSIEPHI